MKLRKNEAYIIKRAYPDFDAGKSRVEFVSSGNELVIPYFDGHVLKYEHVRLNRYAIWFRARHTAEIKIGYGPDTDTYVVKSDSYKSIRTNTAS